MKELNGEKIIIKNSDNEIIFNEKYDNEMLLLKDIQTKVLGRYIIYSKISKNDTTKLKRSDGCTIELVNFKSKVIFDLIDRHILKSYKQFLKIVSKEKYYYIDLIGSKNRCDFDLMDISPKKKNEKTLMCEIELDEDRKITKLGSDMLKIFTEVYLKNWNKIFLSKQDRFKTVVCCDDKTITINNFLLEYTNNNIKEQQDKYNRFLEDGKKVK